MIIRKAKCDEYEDVRAFYHAVIDGLSDLPGTVEWKKDIYPAPDFLRDAIIGGELFIARENESIVGAMVLNHLQGKAYREIQWPVQAEDSEVSVLHALGVLPSYRRRGCAKQMVRFAIDFARKSGQKAIRLDVLTGNLYAQKLYTGMGFQYIDTLPMYYEDTGWKDFELYEYALID